MNYSELRQKRLDQHKANLCARRDKRKRRTSAKPKRCAKITASGTPSNWQGIRAKILRRDGYACRVCHDDCGGGSLDVHHIDHNRTHNKFGNLVSLCPSCHRAVHAAGYIPDPYNDFGCPWGRH